MNPDKDVWSLLFAAAFAGQMSRHANGQGAAEDAIKAADAALQVIKEKRPRIVEQIAGSMNPENES